MEVPVKALCAGEPFGGGTLSQTAHPTQGILNLPQEIERGGVICMCGTNVM